MNANRRPILRWLTIRLASYLEVPATAVDPMVPLAEMGVDSVHAISLVGDVELHFDIDVDPTMIFDYPTLSAIAEFISTAVGRASAAAGCINICQALNRPTRPTLTSDQYSGVEKPYLWGHYHHSAGLLEVAAAGPVPSRASRMVCVTQVPPARRRGPDEEQR